MGLEEFISGILSGGLSYPIAKWLFDNFVPSTMSAKVKRFITYVITFSISTLALIAGAYLGITTLEAETMFAAWAVAFGTATALHGAIDLTGAESVD